MGRSADAQGGVRVAMWSGPRNISTALMRSWDARGDCAVVDEPLYAHYLMATGHPHPGADAILEHHETDFDRVIAALLGPIPNGASVFYQKHMAHHVLPDMDMAWIRDLNSAFLIRDPSAMIASLAKVLPNPAIEETGLPQQVRLLEWLRDETGETPPVFDSRDVLMDPARALPAMCQSLGVSFTERMLSWAPGRRATDGVWAEHWYANVEKSTGFAPWAPPRDEPPARLRSLVRQCEALYQRLYESRMTFD